MGCFIKNVCKDDGVLISILITLVDRRETDSLFSDLYIVSGDYRNFIAINKQVERVTLVENIEQLDCEQECSELIRDFNLPSSKEMMRDERNFDSCAQCIGAGKFDVNPRSFV